MKECTLNNSQLLAACEQWANTQDTTALTKEHTTNTDSPDVLFKELIQRFKPFVALEQTDVTTQPITNTNYKQCYDLLSILYTGHCNNEVYIEGLHEMFLSYNKDHRRTDELHNTIVDTYENLHYLLKDCAKVFEPEQEKRSHTIA